MRDFLRAGLAFVCLALVFSQGTAAFNVSQLNVEPSGEVIPGTAITITGTIDFIPSSDETFPSTHELQFNTDLEKAEWTWSLVLDGIDEPYPSSQGYSFSLSGVMLSYPKRVHESLKFQFEGFAPSVNQTMNKTLIRIQELDKKGIPVPETSREYSALIVSKEVSCCKIPINETLELFRLHIDEKSAMGIDTATAEAKYSEAEQKIALARSMPLTEYQKAFTELEKANKAIFDGEQALDRTWAEKEVADAQVPINNVDNVIAGIKTNCTYPPQVAEIIRKRELAVSYLTTANDKIAEGNYSAARENADIALALGNESYTNALEYKKMISQTTPGVPLSPVCAGVALVIAGFIVARYQHKDRKDQK